MNYMNCDFSNPRMVRASIVLDVKHENKEYKDILFEDRNLLTMQAFRARLDKKVAKIEGKGFKQEDFKKLLGWVKSEGIVMKEVRKIGYDHEAPSMLIPYGGNGRLLNLLDGREDTHYMPSLIGDRQLYTHIPTKEEDWEMLAARVLDGFPRPILVSLFWALASPLDSKKSNEYYPILNMQDEDFAQFLADIMGHNRIEKADKNRLVLDAAVSNSQFVFMPNYKIKQETMIRTIRYIWQSMEDYHHMTPHRQIANVLLCDFDPHVRASLPGRVINVPKASYKKNLLEAVPLASRKAFSLQYLKWLFDKLPEYDNWREEAMSKVPKKWSGGRNGDIVMHMLIGEIIYNLLCDQFGVKAKKDVVLPFIEKEGILV